MQSCAGKDLRDRIARLNSDGSLDRTFNPGADDEVNALALLTDGRIVVGGTFTTLGGHSRDNIGRLNNTDPATQKLSHDSTTISWSRGGTSPEVWRTIFEHSSNGVAWTLLGTGTRMPGGWQLTNVVIPPDGNVRARGQIAGDGSASGWFAETLPLCEPYEWYLFRLRYPFAQAPSEEFSSLGNQSAHSQSTMLPPPSQTVVRHLEFGCPP